MKGIFNQFNELAEQIHQNAVEHGWWEEDRPLVQLCPLFHDELAEAHEEYRSGNELEYELDGKPEGIAVELADYIIRILDYAGKMKMDIDKVFKEPEVWAAAFVRDDFSEFIEDCHNDTTYLYLTERARLKDLPIYETMEQLIGRCILRPMVYMIVNGVDPIAVIKRKHEFNKTRPYRHGGKVC